MIPGFCFPSTGRLDTIQQSVFVIAATPAEPQEGSWPGVQGMHCSSILYLYSWSWALGQGCPAEYKTSNLHISRSRFVRKKICRGLRIYFKHSLSSPRGLKTHLGELCCGLILAQLARPVILSTNLRYSELVIPDIRAGGLWVPTLCSLCSGYHASLQKSCSNALDSFLLERVFE